MLKLFIFLHFIKIIYEQNNCCPNLSPPNLAGWFLIPQAFANNC